MDRISLNFDPSGDARDVREALGTFVQDADAEVISFAETVVERQRDVVAWLMEDEDARLAFAGDPVNALSRRFPDIQAPARSCVRLPDSVGSILKFDPAGSATVLVQRVWDFASVSDANTEAVRQDPLGVVAAQAVGFTPAVLDQVRQAFGTVIATLPAHQFARMLAVATGRA